MRRPRVSVILPVFNRPAYVRESIDSILDQTFGDFELIVVDDGSGPETVQVLESYRDPRVTVLIQENAGPAAARNLGIASAQGEYLAFQDSDDVSLPDRLRRQVAFLDRHREVGLLGAAARIWEGGTPSGRMLVHPVGNSALQRELLFDNPFVATSVMVRRSVWDLVGPFLLDPERIRPEDYEQWVRIARVTRIANLRDPLVIYREVPGSQSRRAPEELQRRVFEIAMGHLRWATGLALSDPAPLAIVRWVHGLDRSLSPEIVVSQAESLLATAFAQVSGDGGLTSGLEAKRFMAWIRVRRTTKRLLGISNPGLAPS